MSIVWDNKHLLWEGLKFTLQLFIVVVALGTAIGIFGGVGLLFGNRPIRAVLRAYVDIIRGMPLLVTIFLLFYGPVAYGINLSPFQSIALALGIFAGAHMSEIVRGAIGSIPKGQIDAAKAIGLTFWPRFFFILLPQALPVILPPWTNLAAEMMKGTSLAVLVSQNDFLFASQKVAIRTTQYLPFYIAAAIVYFTLCFLISRAGVWLGRRFRFGVTT